jgi:hypothetical protein
MLDVVPRTSGRVDATSHAAAIAKVTEAVKFAPQLREHLEEIVRSSAFRGSHRSQLFLRHVVESSLRGESEVLRERSIGTELFSRPADYDTGEDAIVRVTASDVRKRLFQFYANANGDIPFRIELHAGVYVPEFRCVSALDPSVPEEAAADPKPSAEPVAVAEPVAASAPTVSAVARLPRRWPRYAGAAALLLLVGALAGWLAGRRAATRPLADNVASAAFQGQSRSVQVIVSDDAFVLIQVLLGRHFSLEEYENLSYLNVPELTEQTGLKRLHSLLSNHQITNIGDLQNGARIRENMLASGWDVVIRHARQVNARDFRVGNFILLGGAYSDPWVSLFRVDDSNFPLEDSAPPGKVASYLNRHPKPGEPLSFGVESNHNGKTTTYARVSLVENLSRSGRVLLVAGQSVSATELAGEFLFYPESVEKVRGMLGLGAKSSLPEMEMMLRITEANQVGESVQLVACRKLLSHTD